MNEEFLRAIAKIEASEKLSPAGSYENEQYLKAALRSAWPTIKAYAEWQQRTNDTPSPPGPTLVKGAIYQTAFGPAEFLGADTYHGETTYEFVVDRRRKYVQPDRLASFLNR